ncbi:MAG: class I SAM-dependent methyltransferase [Candidatus Woesearchaeota archaeon]
MDRVVVINEILRKLNGDTYLEIGVETGASILQINSKKKLGVDPMFPSENVQRAISKCSLIYFMMTSDKFFDNYSKILDENKIDVAFIDGLHSYKQSLRDVENCLNFLKRNGIIVIHDCNPTSSAMAHPGESYEKVAKSNPANWKGKWCGDVWKTILHLRSTRSDLQVFVLDCDFGIGIIRKEKATDVLDYSIEEIEKMKYEDLEKNREKFLNLKNEEYFYSFLSALETKDLNIISLNH